MAPRRTHYMHDIWYSVYRVEGTGRYNVRVYDGRTLVADLGGSWGWPARDDAINAAIDWIQLDYRRR